MSLSRAWFLLKKNWKPYPEGERGLEVRDHRQMVGGKWDEIGQFQFDYLVAQGLQPNHVLLDIGCGSFRAGRHFMHYLEPGNYIAVEKQSELIREGRDKEIGAEVWERCKPEIVITDRFEFKRLSRQPDFAIAQSVFSHLSARDIRLCMANLRGWLTQPCIFYATFFETDDASMQLLPSHSSRRFEYTRGQMEAFGAEAGWQTEYVGDWGHPRGQHLVIHRPV